LNSRDYKIPQAVCYRKQGHPRTAEEPQSWEQTDTNDTLNAFDNSEGRTPTLVYDARGNGGGDTVNTITGDHQDRVTDYTALAVDCRNGKENGNVNGTLQSKEQGYNTNSNNIVRCDTVVRRLTPLECERLQGYPDGWTDIGEWIDSKGKKHKDADSPRYKALGNSIALPFWEWMAGRMVKELDTEEPTMASLFSGIGGFELVFSRAGCKPVWASEVEEFAIAVTKIRFPEDAEA